MAPSPASAEWQRWFKGSKVVDPQGRPLTMFHGTASRFDRFVISDLDGAYFSSDRVYAFGYAEVKAGLKHGARPVLMAVQLAIKNPLVLDPEDHDQWSRYTERGFCPKQLRAAGYDGVMMRYPDNGEVEAMALSADQIRQVPLPEMAIPPLTPPAVAEAEPTAAISVRAPEPPGP